VTPRRSLWFTIVNVAAAWLMIGIGAAALWPVYDDVRLVLLVAVAVPLGSAIAVAGAAFRWPSFVVLLASVAAFLVVGVPLAVPDRAIAGVLPSPEGLRDLVAGVALGWKQLLTISLPVGSYQALLVPALVLVFAAAVATVSIALRARRGELAAVPPAVLFLVAIVLGPDDVPWPVPLALGMLGTSLLWLVWRRWRRRREAIRELARATPDAEGRPLETAGDSALGVRTVVTAAVILAVAAAASVGAARAVPPTGARDVLRTAIEQPFDPRDYPSPLAGFRRYLRDDRVDDVLFRLEGLPAGALVRIATLDSYDGVVYAVGGPPIDGSSGSFVRVPRSVDRSGLAGQTVDLAVEVVDYTGVWVPTAGLLESIHFQGADGATLADAFYFNDTSGTAAVLGGLAPGDRYRLEAVLPAQPDPDELGGLTPGDAIVPRLGAVPEELSLYLEDRVRGITEPGERLVALLDALASDGYISHGLSPDEPPSRSGHAADRITELVTAPRMLGDDEQYAVAAALMAEEIGFPSRVVFGFAPEGGGAAGATTDVTGGDVSAWVEIDTAEYGWVAIDPVPEDRPIPDDEPEDPTQVARPPSIVPPPADRPDPQVDQSTPESNQEEPDALDPVIAALLAVARVAAIVLLAAGVVAAPFLLVIAAKARRRRLRKTADSTLQRIRGGWDEFQDAVVDHGFAPPPAATRSEVAAVVGALPARVLAAVADRAVFAPDSPDPADADRVWEAVGDLRVGLDAGRTRRQRLRALLSLRSLGGYHVRGLFTRGGGTR
jgi:hypothetical protein